MKSLSRIVTVVLPLVLVIACDQHVRKGTGYVADSSIPEEAPKREALQELRYTAPAVVKDNVSYPGTQRANGTNSGVVNRKKVMTADTVGDSGEAYAHIEENRFLAVKQSPLSTFSIDVDAASYSNVRRFLQQGTLPPPGAVRIEELVNYFDYQYPQPAGDDPFSVNTELSVCPWNPAHRLMLIGLQGRQVPVEQLPVSNLVFLIDVSGSMDEPDKLPLVQSSLKMLTDQLREKDRVAIVVYAGNAGLVLPSTSGSDKQKIKEAIDNLEAGGSTAGGEGLALAYKIAEENFIKGGNNRVILSTDGDFNVGPSSDDALVSLIEKKRSSGIFLSVLGYGTGNYQDNKMQQLADKGNGNHYYIDNGKEAQKVLVSEFGGTLYTIAKDVKIQVEFNPAAVQSYRLIGYENRVMAAEDFNDDRRDAGELGSGHRVTALYELIPNGVADAWTPSVDPLKYQDAGATASAQESMTIKLRYKQPDGGVSKLIEHTVGAGYEQVDAASVNLRFAASVAEFGMLLRNSAYKEQSSWQQVGELAKGSVGADINGYRHEFLDLSAKAASLSVSKR